MYAILQKRSHKRPNNRLQRTSVGAPGSTAHARRAFLKVQLSTSDGQKQDSRLQRAPDNFGGCNDTCCWWILPAGRPAGWLANWAAVISMGRLTSDPTSQRFNDFALRSYRAQVLLMIKAKGTLDAATVRPEF